MTVLATVKGLACAYPDGERIALDVAFSVRPGQCVLLSGPSGSGKSTLLHALAGCFEGPCPHGPSLFKAPDGGPLVTGLVPQNPDTQLFCGTVAEEVAFGPKNHGRPPGEIEAILARLLTELDIAHLAEKTLDALSMGERQRVALASVLALEPHLLLLDEPFAQLDDPGKAKLREILEHEKRRGLAMVIAEHRAEHLGGLADAVTAIPAREEPAASLPELPGQTAKGAASPSGPILAVDSLRFSENGRTVLRDVSFTIGRGEKVLLVGDNGSGKTTLMSCLTGGLAPTGGEVRLAGQVLPPARELVGRIGYLMQNPERCLFELSVEDELSFTMRRLELSKAFVSDQAKALAARLGFGDALARSPMQLSFGQKHATALASVAASLPDLLLLDEPLTGLDNDFCRRMLGLVDELRERHGMAVLMAAHDETCAPWAHRVLRLSNGAISQKAGERP